ncbi:cysteine desulfurase [Patescibacteria group bacterium]|nr:cysteine desulfurase [Patescibacteria group bacterium]MBU2633518.1 cysteine desulfurase [Patescibacteria group bacterium]
MKRVYLDNAATTSMDPRVKKAMDSFWSDDFGNASAIYEEGRVAKKAISEARLKTASILNAKADEIIFTAGGTESDNLAILGVARAICGISDIPQKKSLHIITSKIEHHAVLHACEQLKKEGFQITEIGVDEDGIIDLRQLKNALKPETILISIMLANNEIGTIQPIKEISRIIRNKNILFHTDAVQAPSYLDLNVEKLGVDLMTLNGSKIYGPKGIGILYKKRGIKIEPLLYGGGQESNFRSGTENIPAIVGFTTALELAQKDREKESERQIKLRDRFIKKILEMPNTILNGSQDTRLPNNINVSFRGVEGEAIVLYLDAKGVSCSTGSACNSDSLEASHVIRAIKRPHEYAHGSVRFTMGKETKKRELDYVLGILPDIIKKLKNISAI